ncbi:MAG: NAD(P)-dependent alcohol dehydrogenase [Opitutaceae bacterium]|nr:NAD(P)-dependent alcohol dehydrogenase [Opitutaceae bacterium]
MKSLVLERKEVLALRDIEVEEMLGANDVRIEIHTVGICGSDIHYYTNGEIGPFVVKEPMILGHEASGIVTEIGGEVSSLSVGDRVCMEPGIPDPTNKASRLGLYNLDPSVRFWATPPVHGILRASVVHPADFTFKIPDNVSFGEAAMVEPLAVGMHAATKAKIKPGDIAVVSGAGPIGMVTALSALASGCRKIIMTDVVQPKLDLISRMGPIIPVNVANQNLQSVVDRETDGWGVDIVFECSGNEKACSHACDVVAPGGMVVFVGMPLAPIAFDLVAAQVKEVRFETVFRYAHVYPRALGLMESGKIDVKPLITDNFSFNDSIKAFEFARDLPETSVKAQIILK